MSNYIIAILLSVFGSFAVLKTTTPPDGAYRAEDSFTDYQVAVLDSPPLPGDPTSSGDDNPFQLPPGNLNTEYELNEDGTGYDIHEKIGDIDVRHPSSISMKDYAAWRRGQSISDYWKEKNRSAGDGAGAIAGGPGIGIDIKDPRFSELFGPGGVSIRPTGQALLEFSGDINRMKNPSLPVRQQRTGNFNFDQQIQLNVVGKIGEKLRLTANWDTEATFDFENQFKIEYTGTEDEILQKIEAGNVSLPLKGSLVQGGQNLFGIKVAMKFGPVNVTTIASQQKGKRQEISVEGGAQVTDYEKEANDYDYNRHFFLAHHFRGRYETALENLPNINSGYVINRIEVWITNTQSSSTQQNRNAVGYIDLGEQNNQPVDNGIGRVFNSDIWNMGTFSGDLYPDNLANPLYNAVLQDTLTRTLREVDNNLGTLGLLNGVDYERVENMRKLKSDEYVLNNQLGYISLNTRLQDNQVLFVAYEYQVNGEKFQVGEFSQDKPVDQNELLFLKMLKPSSVRPVYDDRPYPTWDLMMKNIYNMGGYGLNGENFKFEIFYQSPTSAGDLAFLPDGTLANIQLLQLFHMDLLTNNSTAKSDYVFDFIDGITVDAQKGLIKFPVLEPFGGHIVNKLREANASTQQLAQDSTLYAFDALYRKTQVDAKQFHQDVDRYIFKGSYQSSSSSEINLNAINIADGSVQVLANGIELIEGQDYQVDYQIGRVTILNTGLLTSGQTLKVLFETNTLFGIESKTLVGSRVDVNLSKDIQFGGTILHLNERPLTQKINIGDEPLSNTIVGLDMSLRKDSRFLTKIIDALPLLQTKETSTITGMIEAAALLPGHPNVIAIRDSNNKVIEEGVAYLDDFESAKNTFDLSGWRSWQLAAFPGSNGNNDLYDPENDYSSTLARGFSRSKISWYSIDPNFFFNNSGDVFPKADLDDPYTRQVNPNEVFQNKDLVVGDNLLRTLDIQYRPAERGPYNFQADGNRVDVNGQFSNPEENWGGIMRRTSANTDFEAANYEFIEFFMLDPFINDPNNDGELYIDIGKVSEDIVPDNRRMYENGLPEDGDTTKLDRTPYGFVPNVPAPTLAFSNDPQSRQFQDVGFDGMSDEQEAALHAQYLTDLAAVVTNQDVLNAAQNDPSNDNYAYFRSDEYDAANAGILDRYQRFNDTEGNTPTGADAQRNGYSTQGTPQPDTEDINVNGTLNTNEEYWEYKIKLKRSDLKRGSNFVVDEIESVVDLNNSSGTQTLKWYQFRIPLTAGTPIGSIQNFKSIDFIRMYMTGFERPVVLRMAKMQLVSTTWRTYKNYLGAEDELNVTDPSTPLTTFEIGTVNIEDNGGREPFPYNTPPNIVREQIVGSIQVQGALQNEQSLVLRTCNLQDGDGRAAFRNFQQDLRSYKRMKMWVHAEAIDPMLPLDDSAATAFIRLGTDNSENYYEYEIPLVLSKDPEDVYAPPPLLESGRRDQPLDSDRYKAWKNEFDFDLATLALSKSARAEWAIANGKPLDDNPELYRIRYKFDQTLPEGHAIYVVGTPKTSDIKTIMVGIRNKKDDGPPICLETWFNELRVVDFNEQAGYAAKGRFNFKLADFGNISVSGSYQTPGFGSLEQKINLRSREWVKQFDLAGTFQLGKFFPKKWGLQVPLYMTYGQRIVDPQYNPLEADVLTSDYLELFNGEERQRRRNQLQYKSINRSISLNNIRKTRTNQEKKARLWDIENWAASFSVAEVQTSSHQIEYRQNLTHKASLKYNYNFNPKLIQIKKNPKHKNPISMFNFYLFPKSVSFSIDGTRRYEENRIRQTANTGDVQPTYFKDFRVNRQYSLRWDFTRSLSLTYNATNNARVDENLGPGHTDVNRDTLLRNMFSFGQSEWADSTNEDSLFFLNRYEPGKDKILNIGRNMGFNQSVGVNYTLPFDKYPWTNWLSGTVSYQGTFGWRAGPDNQPGLGNIVNNSNNIQGTARLNLQNLYDKIPGLKKFTAYPAPNAGSQGNRRGVESRTKPPEGESEESDSTKNDNSFFFLKVFAKEFLRVLTSVKNVDANYSVNNNTTLPGYLPNTDIFGMDLNHFYHDSLTSAQTGTFWNRANAPPPSWPFVFGWQLHQDTILQRGARDGWLSKDPALSSQFIRGVQKQFTGRTSVTLFKDFKVDLNVSWNQGENFSALMRYDEALGEFVYNNQITNGNFSMSYIFIRTAFEKNDNLSQAFEEFKNQRFGVSQELAGREGRFTPDGKEGYYNGYNSNSQEVLIPAFIAGYSKGNAVNQIPENPENPFPKIPLPNWNVNYTGLGKLPALKSVFNSFTIKHNYRSTFSIGNYTSNLDYNPDGYNRDLVFSDTTLYNYQSKYAITSVNITESLSPLVGVNMNWKNGLTSSVDFKTTRNLAFNVGALQVNETRTKDISIAIGWRKDKLNSSFRLFGKDIQMKNSLNARLEFTLRDRITRNRNLDPDIGTQVTAGNLTVIIKPTVDYTVNKRVNVMFFVEQNINRPYISTSFPTSFTSIGFRIRFTL